MADGWGVRNPNFGWQLLLFVIWQVAPFLVSVFRSLDDGLKQVKRFDSQNKSLNKAKISVAAVIVGALSRLSS